MDSLTDQLKRYRPQILANHATTIDAIKHLPLYGTVAIANGSYGGHVGDPNKSFFHKDDRLNTTSGRGVSGVVGAGILYVLGADPSTQNTASKQQRAVQWCFVDDVTWDGGKPPKTQAEYDELRQKHLDTLGLAALAQTATAAFYAKKWAGRTPPTDLSDGLLRATIADKLNNTQDDGLFNIVNQLEQSPYKEWKLSHSAWVEWLLNRLGPQQIKSFCPPHTSLVALSDRTQVLFIEWVLLRSTDVDVDYWLDQVKGLIHRPGTPGVVVRLLKNQEWSPSKRTYTWICGLIKANHFDINNILDRLVIRPEEYQYWQECLDGYTRGRWLASIPENQLDKFLASVDRDLALSVILARAIAFDLESDGQTIREIGISDIDGSRVLYDEKVHSTSLDAALQELSALLKTKRFVIGHNASRWDMPILVKQHGNLFDDSVIVWDTLLVSCLISPWDRIHALGSNHRAADDALACFNLFKEQVTKFDVSMLASILKDRPTNTNDLIRRLSESLETIKITPPALPDWSSKVSAHRGRYEIALLPRPLLRDLFWDNEFIPIELMGDQPMTLDASSLPVPQAGVDTLGALVVRSILRRAEHNGISVTKAMLPPALRYQDGMEKFLDSAMAGIPPTNGKLLVAAYPSNKRDWDALVSSKQLVYVAPPLNGLILAADSNTPPQTTLPRPAAPCLYQRIDQPGLWLWYAPIPTSDSNGRCWNQFMPCVPSGVIEPIPLPELSYQVQELVDEVLHHPTSSELRDYWVEVLERFLAVSESVKHQTPKRIPMLVLVSSTGQKLLESVESALVSLGRTELPNGRTRLERLRRMVQKPSYCVVDVLSSVEEWSTVAAALGVELFPVIEALPLHEWYALLASKPDQPEKEDHDTENDSDGTTPDAELDPEDTAEFELKDVADSEDPVTLHAPEVTTEADADPLKCVANHQIIKTVFGQPRDQLFQTIDAWLSNCGLISKSPVFLLDPRINTVWSQRLQSVRLSVSRGDRKSLEHDLDQLQPRIERETPATTSDALNAYLIKYWGYEGFHPWQEPVVQAIAPYDADVLVTLPTGGGKSVLFQVPALYRGEKTRRLSLVISPLRALMQDQVEDLHKRGFQESADYLASDRPWHESEAVFQGVLDHRICLLYVAPERFRSKRFIELLDRRHQSDDDAFEFIIIDEAHCVGQWGYEFRPDYFYAMKLLRERYRQPSKHGLSLAPFILFSATVTSRTQEDLKKVIGASTVRNLRVVPSEYFNPIREHIQILTQAVEGRISGSKAANWQLEPRIEALRKEIDKALANKNKTGANSAVIIFVSRRAHAEELAFLLSGHYPKRVDYFHAGLDAERRREVYDEFKACQLDILIATKAFGMGMDIGHIHWAIHLSPPSYLEDYFQEVGRIGRNKHAMVAAGLNALNAILLHSQDDFSSNLAAIQRSRIDFPQLEGFLREARKEAKPAGSEWIAVVPDVGFATHGNAAQQRAATTRVRVMLHWLEKMNRTTLLQMLPGLLQISIGRNRGRLEQFSKNNSPQADVARCILDMIQSTPSLAATNPKNQMAVAGDQVPGLFEEIVAGLGHFFGFMFGASPAPLPNAEPQQASPTQGAEGLINLAAISRATSIPVFDVLQALSELQKQGAIEIIRSLRISQGALHRQLTGQQIKDLFQSLRISVQSVANSIVGKGEVEISDGLLGQGFSVDNVQGKAIDIKMPYEKGLLLLLRVAGARTYQKTLGEGNELRRSTCAILSKSRNDHAPDRILDLAELLTQETTGSGELSLHDLLQTVAKANQKAGKPYRQRELQQVLGLLASLRLFHCLEPLVPMSYVLKVIDPDKSFIQQDHPTEFSELQEVNRLAELRGHGMELFVALPADARDKFVEDYFGVSTSDGMEEFLRHHLLNVQEPSQSRWVDQKRAQIQAEGIKNLFDPFRETTAPSPNQWKAISHPFNRNLLVNAGPGSGKTTVLVARVAHLIHEQKLRPEEIMVLAFNRAVVFEIRSRIRELFHGLGYGAYVRGLRVSTFHALATRHLERNAGDGDNILGVFAQKLINDDFARTVASGIRTILVDEFQDADRNILTIVQRLQAVTGASVMAIGDDDQDVLRWIRLKANLQPPATQSSHYFEQFGKLFPLEPGDRLSLDVNFRSGKIIVDRSQNLLNKFFIQTFNPPLQPRCKAGIILNAKPGAIAGNITALKDGAANPVREQLIVQAEAILQNMLHGNQESIAILCRSNAEVVELYQHLQPIYPTLRILQKSADLHLVKLRHVACLVDLCGGLISTSGDLPLNNKLRDELLAGFRALVIPEAINPGMNRISLENILDLVDAENSYARLSDVVTFVESTKIDEFFRMLDKRSTTLNTKPAVVSTIHKVKGLEFDKVVIIPSNIGFPSPGDNDNSGAATEEARLFYVALTRAKQAVFYGFGDREWAWWEGNKYQQNNVAPAQLVKGALDKEVQISWAANQSSLNAKGVQSYIKQHVAIGDDVIVQGNCLYHRLLSGQRRLIGMLVRPKQGGINSRLKVSAVVRYPQAPDPNKPRYFKQLIPQVQQQGWSYVVLVAGTL